MNSPWSDRDMGKFKKKKKKEKKKSGNFYNIFSFKVF